MKEMDFYCFEYISNGWGSKKNEGSSAKGWAKVSFCFYVHT